MPRTSDERDLRHEYRRFLSDHAGHPLGPGMPLGSPLRIEVWHEPSQMWRGESHLMAWERVMRWDPCAFCGKPYSFTVDHIEPRTLPIRGIGRPHSWINVAGACEACNNAKQRKSLLRFLCERAQGRPRPKRTVDSRVFPTLEDADDGRSADAQHSDVPVREAGVGGGGDEARPDEHGERGAVDPWMGAAPAGR